MTDWLDQGIFIDITAHVGTFGAVILYFFIYIKKIFINLLSFKKNYFKKNNHMGIKVIITTMQSLLVGFL